MVDEARPIPPRSDDIEAPAGTATTPMMAKSATAALETIRSVEAVPPVEPSSVKPMATDALAKSSSQNSGRPVHMT